MYIEESKENVLRVDLNERTLQEGVLQIKENGVEVVSVTNIQKRFSCTIDFKETTDENRRVNQKDITGFLFTEEGVQFEGKIGTPVLKKNVKTVILSEGGVLRLLFRNGTEKILGIKFYEPRMAGSDSSRYDEENALRKILSELVKKSFPNAEFRHRSEQEAIAEQYQ